MEQKVEVKIVGYPLTLKADVHPEEAKRIARYVDTMISETMDHNGRLGVQLASILSAVNIAGELFSTKKELEELREISREPMENYESLSEECKHHQSEIDSLHREISRLKDDLVRSLNTIGDINKRMSGAAQETEDAKRALEDKKREMERIENSLTRMQENMISMTKENQELKRSIVYNKGILNDK